MAVAIKTSGADFDHESPVRLFDTHVAAAVFTRALQDDASADGSRFVVATATTSTGTIVPPVTVVVNWASQPTPP